MNESKRKAMIGIVAGLTLQIIARLLPISGTEPVFLFAVGIFLVAALFFIWGCTHYALTKGWPHWLGYLGFFSVLGLIVLYLLPVRRSNEARS